MHDEIEEEEELVLDDQQKKKRNGRKRTRMHHVHDRADKPPVPVHYNAEGQPDGDNASEFTNFLATLVKSHIPLGHEDWRLVAVKRKNELLPTLRKYYVVDDKFKDYVFGSAHKKWRNFKAGLKEKHFKPEKTDEELYALRDERKQSEQGKQNQKGQKVLHKPGSKSYGHVTAEMHKEKGYAPRRDEVILKTHTSKDGTALNAETAKVIDDIELAIENHPELLEKSIEQGDILSRVLGEEKNGYVRCIGLGPTTGALGIPGAQKLKSTKLQMAELEAEKAWMANEVLMDYLDEIRADTKAQVDAMMEEMNQPRSMMSQYIDANNNAKKNIAV